MIGRLVGVKVTCSACVGLLGYPWYTVTGGLVPFEALDRPGRNLPKEYFEPTFGCLLSTFSSCVPSADFARLETEVYQVGVSPRDKCSFVERPVESHVIGARL